MPPSFTPVTSNLCVLSFFLDQSSWKCIDFIYVFKEAALVSLIFLYGLSVFNFIDLSSLLFLLSIYFGFNLLLFF